MNREIVEYAEAVRSMLLSLGRLIGPVAEVVGLKLDFDPAEGLRTSAKLACLYIAGADGPINKAESDIINILFDEDKSQTEHNIHFNILKRDNNLFDSTANLLEFTVTLHSLAIEQSGAVYRAEDDGVAQLLSHMGQLVALADNDSDPIELRVLSKITTKLREHAAACEVERASMRETPEFDHGQRNEESEELLVPISTAESSDPLAQLHTLIGLDNVKLEVETLANLARVFSLRKEKALPVPDMSFHLVFSGNPGTGKTTVARILSRIYGKLGLLSKGHLVEVDRSGLVANYVGQTATKTRQAIEKAKGGVLFIDEAYSLSSRGDNDFGREAIEIILKSMEDHREDLVVIVAGYTDEMAEFIQMNPGLRSRFARTIHFDDYSAEDMVAIFKKFAKDSSYSVAADADPVLESIMHRMWSSRSDHFGNARDVRLAFEKVVSAHANRLSSAADITDDDLSVLHAPDFVCL